MTEPLLTRPLRRLTQGELNQFLDKVADTLRGGVDAFATRCSGIDIRGCYGTTLSAIALQPADGQC